MVLHARGPPATRGNGGGIEAIIAARRAALPTHDELRERTRAVTSHLSRETTPSEVFAIEEMLANTSGAQQSRPMSAAGRMTLEEFDAALAAVERGDDPSEEAGGTSDGAQVIRMDLTARELAAELSEKLGLEAAPLTKLVAEASEVLGIDYAGANLIEQLRTCHAHVATDPSVGGGLYDNRHGTLSPLNSARGMSSAAAGDEGSHTNGSLLDGAYDEAGNAASFAEAVAAFRGEAAPPASRGAGTRGDAERDKGPSLGERLLAKGLVRGCSTPR